MRLHEALAIRKGAKSGAYNATGEIDNLLQKAEPQSGFNKTWEKLNDDAPDLPPQSKHVQFVASEAIEEIVAINADWLNIEATVERGNESAKADLMVDGVVLVKDAPGTYLLTLGKFVKDTITIMKRAIVADAAIEWTRDEGTGLLRGRTVTTPRTMKRHKALVLHPPTKEHPAQTQVVTEDDLIGHYRTTPLSGALTRKERRAILARLEALSRGVKTALAQANNAEVEKDTQAGVAVLRFIFPRE